MPAKVVVASVRLGFLPASPPPPSGLVWTTTNPDVLELTPDESGHEVTVGFQYDVPFLGALVKATLNEVVQATAELDYEPETGELTVTRA